MNLNTLFESDFNDKKHINEVDPRNFDSDEDYYAAQNAPAKPRYRGQQSPGVDPDDEAYFREIFRKKREAAAKAAQDKGVAETKVGGNAQTDPSKATHATYSTIWPGSKSEHKMEPVHHRSEEAMKGHVHALKKKYGAGNVSTKVQTNQGVAEGINDTIYPNAEVIKSRNGKPVGEIYQDASGWGCFHYRADNGADSIGSREEALEWLKDIAEEYRQDRSLRKQGVAEADKKKDELEPEVRDVALQRAISRAKADFPTAGTGIEALAKGFMRSQDEDQKSFDQIRQAERKQDQMLSQINKIDQEQEQEIQGLEQQNSGLAGRLQQLQNVNSELEKKLAAMSGRRADKKSTAVDVSTAPAPVATKAAEPATKSITKTKTKAKAPATSVMKSTAAQLAAPKADPMAAMTNRITKGDSSVINKVSGQSALPFEPSDNILEPVIPQAQQNPRFAAAKANASDADPRYYADLTSKIAKKAIQDPEAAQSAYRVHEGDNEEQEANYSDKYQDMVARVGQKAREQEKSKPVDIADLARRLAAIEASKKD